jgi:aspartate/methionine/tyrosine aminotransferase
MSKIRDKMDPSFNDLPRVDFAGYVKATQTEGVAPMSWADSFYPDPCVPKHVIDAVKDALDAGKTHYTMPIGDTELRQEVAKKLKSFNKIEADPDTEIIITPGSDTGLYHAIRPFIIAGKGEEVLIPDPSYGSNFANIKLMGGIPVSVPLREENGFQFDIADMESRVTEKTKMLLMTHPNNPTTTVFSRQNLEQLSQFVIKHDLVVVIDQVFEGTIFDDREFVSLASLPGMWERCVTVFSTSKSMSLCGFRVAYNAACAEIMSVMHASAVYILGATNTFAQAGVLAALRNDGFVTEYNRVIDLRRIAAHKVFNSIPGVHCLMPEATFLIWVNISALGTSIEVAAYLREYAKVAVSTGSNYGKYGEGYLRFNIALLDEDKFNRALEQIVLTLTDLAKKRGIQ